MFTLIKATAFPCPHPGCPRVFEVIRHLNRHVEIHDPKTKRFACPWADCNHTTRQRSNLKTHMKKHTNTKDLCCSKCDYATGDPALALRHQQRVHGYKARTYRKRRSSISEASSSSSSPDSEASFPVTPTADEKPELDKWHSYPFDDSFTSVQAKSLYPAAEAIPALSYPAFDVDSLSGYDWSLPSANAESPVSSPDTWSSWAPTPAFEGESSLASFDWSSSLDQNAPQFMAASPDTSSSFHSTPFLSSPVPFSVPYTEQSLEQFFSIAVPELYPSSNVSFPSEPIPSYYDPYSREQFSSTQYPGIELFNGL